MDNNEIKNELENLEEFNEKYKHYLDEDEDNNTEPAFESQLASDNDGYEDVSSHSYEDEAQEFESESSEKYDEEYTEKKRENFFTKNKCRNIKIIALSLVIAILLGAGIFYAWLVWSTKSDGYGDDGIDYGDNINDSNYLVDDNTSFEVMGDIDADSLNAFLYKWANNGGEKMYNKNVINVLLCGVDSEYDLCDAQILVSIDKVNEKITMVSFLRDSWTYIRMPKSDGSYTDMYEKVNAAYHGGPTTLKQTIENNYKIVIDQYIAVDFKSFPKLIDALGGVTVEVKQYESDYIRRTSSQTDFPSGKATLNGKQALIYSRIRHCDSDSDLSRTRRQRTVIKSLINSAQTATNGQLVNAFKQVSSYLRTGYTQSEVLTLIATAYSHGWMDFEIEEYIMPNEDYVERIGGYVNSSTWAWTVDYPLCAQRLQNILYGKSNIVLSDDRESALDFVSNWRNTTGSSSNSGSSQGSSDDPEPVTDEPYYEPSTDEPITDAPIDEPVDEPDEPETDAPDDSGSDDEQDPMEGGHLFNFGRN